MVTDFLAKNYVTTLQHLLNWLLARLKSTLKVRRFCDDDAADIIKNATEKFKRLSKMASKNVCTNSSAVTDRSV